ncbi:hypothetical protein MPTP_0579 [Melissococcus plutonius ATCC 35311]|uniref:Uncharacterized protein n=1 Tax=Melissococcus plutonius (strain ATCC 35311 / DSM 29964 / CIP 104052 / LMG 20360 / NCIMB 702443) TaxID=940190 RepID=F3Y969_MELPT|nr:hypothetical protein MPTP_0579 [Melissococcus plutonius ATCC 35311]BBD14883.1 hypothetical protein DAT585_0519 [Melissococcus plutonius]BBD16322.1 hypothetical protein DAT606_0275 [Melissococcus plutonius]BBP06876.1 hypothetical protein DAT1033_0275 [Melissococcus plutonius]
MTSRSTAISLKTLDNKNGKNKKFKISLNHLFMLTFLSITSVNNKNSIK